MKLKLNDSNYYSREADIDYCSKSQLTNFFGSPAVQGCEARAYAELKGEITREVSEAMILGSYVDCALTEPDKLEEFKANHPEMYSSRGATAGQLKSQFKVAEAMVERCKRDKYFMKFFEKSEKQTIFTGKIFDVDFKCKLDCYIPGVCIADLKTTGDFTKEFWDKEQGRRINFMQAYRYDLQAAIYQELVYQNTGERLPFYICAVTKQEHPRIDVFQIDQDSMDSVLAEYEDKIRSLPLIKRGDVKPCNCGVCDYCADNYVIKSPKDWIFRETEE